jgi:rsbT co-antagonist protein RsbR
MVESRTAELNRALESLQANLEVLREIGSPILPIFSGVILVPLVGAIDSARAERTMDAVLHGVYEHRARVVLLDITGVPTVDTAVANALVRTAQGVRLLGATPVLVGVRAEVAQTIVDLGIDLQGIVTQASLQEGLEYALRAQGVRLIAEAAETPSLAQRPWNR